MIKLIIILLASVAAWGVTASPTAITVYMRKFGAYPMLNSRPPVSTTITISGTGAWNMSRGGSLSTLCNLGNGYCFNAVAAVTSGCSGALPSGNDAGTTYLCWNGLMTNEATVGTHTGTLTIGSTVINITLIVETPFSWQPWTYLTGYPSGCSTPTNYDTGATCVITNEQPTSTAFSIPAVGATYVDPQLGHIVRRVTASGKNIQYGSLSSFSANGTYILTTLTNPVGEVNVITVATGAVAYTHWSGANINFAAWDAVDENIVWFMEGASIKYRNLSGGTTTTAATYAYNITMGGTVDITDDGWWAFRDSTTLSGDMCAVNLNGLTTSNQSSKTFCASMAAYSFSDFDFTQISQIDSETQKRYVVAVAAPSSQVFSVGTSSLTYEYAIPSGSGVGDLSVEPHSDIGQDEFGRQIFFWNWEDPYASVTYSGAFPLNKGSQMMRPIEEGGGLRILSMIDPDNLTTDGHFGCTWRAVCVYTPYGNSSGITAKAIQSITAANPCQINSTSHGYSSSNSVLIGGALGTGTSPMNAVHTVTVTNVNLYTIPIDCSSGYTYTANSAHSTLNTASAIDAPFRQEIMVTRIGQDMRRIAVHRTKTYEGGTLTAYAAAPRASISRDGSMIAYASNMGVPEHQSVYVAYTGITTAQSLKVSIDPSDTKAVINYVFPAGFTVGAATVTISTLPSLLSPVVSASDGLTTQSRQYVATGLTADTLYYYRIAATNFTYAGQFRTLPTLSGTGRMTISKGNGGTVNYGTTSSLGSSCTSPCDLAPTRGVLYTDSTGGAKATVVR